MSRALGPKCRRCRREGIKLFLKGNRCYLAKCAIEKRQTVPGMHADRRRKMTDYGMQLREKQRLKRIYGMLEAQFVKFFNDAERQSGNTGENFLRLLERRLDSVVWRMGFAPSHTAARQLISHGHVLVNGRRVDVASYLVRVNDEVRVKKESMRKLVEASFKDAQQRGYPAWIEVAPEEMKGTVKAFPAKEDIALPVDVNMVVTYFSR